MARKFLIDGNWLICSEGTCMQRIQVNSQSTIYAHGKLVATMNDRMDGNFNYCTGLQEAYIGDGVTEIAAKAFAECTALKTVVIGKSIQRIGDQAFNTRSSWDQMTLEKITVLFDDIASGSFPVLESGSRGVFPKPGGWDLVSYKIYVPKGTKAEYQKNWSDYSSLIVEMQ